MYKRRDTDASYPAGREDLNRSYKVNAYAQDRRGRDGFPTRQDDLNRTHTEGQYDRTKDFTSPYYDAGAATR